jgi:hypothetical protein
LKGPGQTGRGEAAVSAIPVPILDRSENLGIISVRGTLIESLFFFDLYLVYIIHEPEVL